MIQELNHQFGLGQQLVFREHASGFIVGEVDSSLSSGQFFLHGAHLASYRPKSQSEDLIFMSEKSFFEPGKAIRGGVLICFPWFGPHPSDSSAPAHGLVRTTSWEMISGQLDGDVVVVRMACELDGLSLVYEMRFGSDLKLSFTAENTSPVSQSCELALHTYFDLKDATTAQVHGLEQIGFFDKVSSTHKPPSGKPIRFDRETDSVYIGEVNELRIDDPARGRTIVVRPENSQSTVVWNPWIAKSQKMADFGDDEYQRMCCVETARVGENQLKLDAGTQETVAVTISVA